MDDDVTDEKDVPSRGFAKLDVGIVDSTLWMKPHDALRVWIALLAKCDSYGIVRAAAPALAHLCFVTLDRFEEIIEEFASPDRHSRTPDNEGRRLQKIEGGWLILNYLRYRDMMQRKAASHAERQAKYREKVKVRDARVTRTVTRDTEADSRGREQKAEAVQKLSSPAASELDLDLPDDPVSTTPKPLSTAEREFEDLWSICEKRQGKGSALKAYLKARKSGQMPDIGTVKAAYCRMAESWDWTKEDRQYHPLLATWLNRQGWTDVPRGGGPPQSALKMIFGVKANRTPEEEARMTEGAEIPED